MAADQADIEKLRKKQEEERKALEQLRDVYGEQLINVTLFLLISSSSFFELKEHHVSC